MPQVHNETHALSKMRGNKRVVQLLDVFEDDETVFLVLEWCERGDFFTYVKAKSKALYILYNMYLF